MIGNAVRNQARKDGDVIYGARAMRKQIGLLRHARSTRDYDVFSKKPKMSALKLERTLDKKAKKNVYYTKPALHPGTWKVMDRGRDMRKGTKDDFGIADYTKKPRKLRTVTINGVKYSHISEEVKNRKKSLRDPKSSFRHEKDRRDLALIKGHKEASKY